MKICKNCNSNTTTHHWYDGPLCHICYQKYYNLKNKNKKIKYQQEYRRKNKDRIIKQNYVYKKHKRKSDPFFKVREIVSGGVGYYLRKNKGSKNNSSILKFLPYTIQELKEHLEKQFEPWMNWNNHGNYSVNTWDDKDSSIWTWQVDHIIPHSTFKYSSMDDEEFQECWDLFNLRPLSSKQNISDGARK